MSEKASFQVNSQGIAEPVPGERSKNRGLLTREFTKGMVIGTEGELYSDPNSPEARAYGKYYVDAGGRTIDISTGDEVTPGSGRFSHNIKAIQDYEEQNK